METTQWIVFALGVGAAIAAFFMIIFGARARKKIALVRKTPISSLAQVAGMPEGCMVHITGQAVPQAPLVSPATGKQCLYYKHQVEQMRRHWSNDASGRRREVKDWVTVVEDERQADFAIRDEAGEVLVLSEGAEIMAQQTMDGTEGSFGYDAPPQEGPSMIDQALDKMDFLDEPVGSYRTHEWIIPLETPVHVLGCIYHTPTGSQLRKAGEPLIVTHMTAEELAKEYSFSSVLTFICAGIFGVGGIAAIVYALQFMK